MYHIVHTFKINTHPNVCNIVHIEYLNETHSHTRFRPHIPITPQMEIIIFEYVIQLMYNLI